MQVSTVKEKDTPKREFAFSQEFPNESMLAFKAYDRVFKELTSIANGKITFPEEYGVVNNLYKFRYITPGDISTFVSNLIKVLKNQMIHPHINDMEKFAVSSVKQFMIDHECVPIEHSSIYGLYNYTTDNMTLRDLLVLCENDFYHRTVVSKFEMEQRVKVMKKDYQKMADMHFTSAMQKIIENLPKLITQTEFNNLNYVEQKAIQTYIEEFILFATMMNTVIMSNMIFFCVPKSTYDTKLMTKKTNYDTNNLLDGDLDEDTDDESVVTESKQEAYTECCLLKTNTIQRVEKIPFDINMRNIVLQDMHPHFKDTKAAIEYITHDHRSPISQMLYRYGHQSETLNGLDGYMICKMFVNDPCARCQSFDEYANKLHGVDFHTDVCWLDRIAFGNNFLDGNYREDALGNEHKHPIKQTLSTLYQMFGETKLKTKEELANHIIKVAHVMTSIIDMWGSSGIYNWELVRDILAVLGEIMTRSIIKLYDNERALIVSDNMDNVDSPGYMYTESASPSVKLGDNVTKNKIKSTLGKIYLFIKRLLHKFTTWVHSILSKMGFSFSKNHKLEVERVYKNKVINKEIEQALSNGSFKPNVENWPNYKLKLVQKTNRRLTDIVEDWLRVEDKEHVGVPTVQEIKNEFYPKDFVKLINDKKSEKTVTESYLFPERELELLLQEWEYDDVMTYQESVDISSKNGSKPCYICFTCRKNQHTSAANAFLGHKKEGDDRDSTKRREDFIWDALSNIVGSNILHVGISLDPSLKKTYTYHNKSPFDQQFNGSKDGLRTQNFLTEYNHKGEGIVIYTAFLNNKSWEDMNAFINDHVKHQDESFYNWAEIFLRFIKKSDSLKPNDYGWMCSSFVNAVLHASHVYVNKISDSPAPSDTKNRLLKRNDFSCVFVGPAEKYDPDMVIRRTRDFADEQHTKNADESMGLIIGPEPEKVTKDSAHIQKIKNYFLYSQLEQIPPSNELTAEKWRTLIKNITELGNTFENELENVLNDNETAANKMQSVVKNLENKIDQVVETAYDDDQSKEYNRLRKQLDRNRIVLQAVNEIAREYTAIYASVIEKRFFNVQYKLYRDTVSVYKASR
jgi:hypothetical protein